MAYAYRGLLKYARAVDSVGIVASVGNVSSLVQIRAKHLMRRYSQDFPDDDPRAGLEAVHQYMNGLDLILRDNDNAHAGLVSILEGMLTGKGNYYNRLALEEGFIAYVSHQAEKAQRSEDSLEAVDDRQNKVLQRALVSYAQRLIYVHNNSIGTSDGGTVTQVLRIPEVVVLDVVEDLNKQTIYIDTQNFIEDVNVDAAPTTTCDKLKDTLVHADSYASALRIFHALMDETNIHRSRATYIVGHGRGGGVASLLGLLLLAETFDIKNVITFGATKVVETTLERYKDSLNCIRVVIVGDSTVNIPVSTPEGNPYIHFGEVLNLHPATPSSSEYNMDTYFEYMKDSTVLLSYQENSNLVDDDGPLSQKIQSMAAQQKPLTSQDFR
eukprot:PhF_6_TR33867/c0_g1_i1/m.49698